MSESSYIKDSVSSLKFICVLLLGVYIQTQWHHVFLYRLTLVHQPSKQATEIKGCFCKASFTVKRARELFKRSDPSNLV